MVLDDECDWSMKVADNEVREFKKEGETDSDISRHPSGVITFSTFPLVPLLASGLPVLSVLYDVVEHTCIESDEILGR